jgi:hypothetical protein
MSERVALDYTNGTGEDIPCETWTGIDAQDVVDYARSRIPAGINLPKNSSLIELANVSETGLSDTTRKMLKRLLGKDVLILDS